MAITPELIMTIEILLVDDHQLVRKGLKALLDNHERYNVIAEASNGIDALKLITEEKPDLVLLDIMMPDRNGLEVASDILNMEVRPRIILLTMYHLAEYIHEALKLGIHGYVVKDAAPTELFSAIDTVMRNEIYLSPSISHQIMTIWQKRKEQENLHNQLTARQVQILRLIALGYSSKTMADELHLSIKTIEAHRSQLMQRLGMKDVASLVRYAIRTGLVDN